jgi:predicted DsbA family dithiol-disulfide isomerase
LLTAICKRLSLKIVCDKNIQKMNKIIFIIILSIGAILSSFYAKKDVDDSTQDRNNYHKTEIENKMKIEIWSDIVCPWCYIGKRRLENALAKFEDAQYIEIEYKSFQLNPDMQTNLDMSVVDYLVKYKAIPKSSALQMMNQVTNIASSLELEYHLDKAIAINTLQAHALLHYAKTENKQLEMKERLMKAYFTEAKNVDDLEVLLQLATEVGLDENEVKTALESKQFAQAVQADIQQARNFGVQGVPFFVFNREFAISGAQEETVFLQTIQKAYTSWRKTNPIQKFETIDGKVCTPEGDCD